MRYLISFLIAVALVCPAIGQVIGAEYFIDTDPGYGKATYVTITSGNPISKDILIALSSTVPGFHLVSLRAKDAQGHWSHTYTHSFYVLSSLGSTSVGSEYYMDNDPGYGKATAIPTAFVGDSLKYVVPLTAVSAGFHTLGLRSKDDVGRWSHTYAHSFYAMPTLGTTLAGSEYYIDTDPGYGKAANIPAALAGDSMKYVVPLTAYSTGFHTMGLRSKDNAGRWSHTTQHAFYISNNGTLENITALKYYFTGTGSTDSIYTYQVPVPAASVNLDFIAELKQLVGDREYTMHVWAVNAKGVRSEVFMRKVKACSGDPSKATFDFISLGKQVSFIDGSKGGSKYQWNFGDGKIDSVSNPVHTYAAGGNYTVRLVVSNFCNSDTATKLVSVLTLQSIYPSVGGNKGTVTVSVKGAGFSANTVIRLLPASGSSEIKADSVLVNNTGSILTGILNLNGKQPGVYNVVVNTNTAFDTLISAFVIQVGELPNVFVDIIGRDVIRGNGTEQKYSIHFGNKSNNDVYAMPLWISGLPKNARWHLYAAIDTVDENNNPTPVEVIMHDSSKAIPLIIARLPAKSDFTVELGVAVPAIGDTFQLVSWLSRPLFSAATPEEEPTYKSVQSLINYATGEFTGATLSPGCLTGSTSAFYSFLKKAANRQPVVNPSVPRFFVAYTKLLVETGKTISACAGNVQGNSYEAFYKNFLQPLYELEEHFGNTR